MLLSWLFLQLTKNRLASEHLLISAPYLWNTLPLHVKEASSVENFKSRLKTHLCSLFYSLP
ncbi:hypothetical protein LDENG_00297760 [Lucifuga dentata]|nr:hypothetical protein LDENG_00297760 [Lucifuga dentata]